MSVFGLVKKVGSRHLLAPLGFVTVDFYTYVISNLNLRTQVANVAYLKNLFILLTVVKAAPQHPSSSSKKWSATHCAFSLSYLSN